MRIQTSTQNDSWKGFNHPPNIYPICKPETEERSVELPLSKTLSFAANPIFKLWKNRRQNVLLQFSVDETVLWRKLLASSNSPSRRKTKLLDLMQSNLLLNQSLLEALPPLQRPFIEPIYFQISFPPINFKSRTE
jgi:hypothetical protein